MEYVLQIYLPSYSQLDVSPTLYYYHGIDLETAIERALPLLLSFAHSFRSTLHVTSVWPYLFSSGITTFQHRIKTSGQQLLTSYIHTRGPEYNLLRRQ
jgi:hypothetical protein